MNQTYQPVCSKCSSPTNYRAGIGKESGKPYAGYFCTNPQCKNVDFVKTQPPAQDFAAGAPMGAGNPPPPPQQQPPPAPPNGNKDWDQINAEKQRAILWGQALNNAKDYITSGVNPPATDVVAENYQLACKLFAQYVRMPRVTTDMMAGRDPGPQSPPPGY